MVRARFVTDTANVEVQSVSVTSSVNVESNIVTGSVGVSSYPSRIDHNKLINRDLPDQHPISAITGLEEALRRADTFVFEQAVASDTWEIEHDLNKFPSVTIVDSAGTVYYPAVQYIDENNVIVTMNGATTGKAYLN